MQNSSKKVLMIHHGGHAGGAPLSLLYTAIGLISNKYHVEIALMQPTKELHELYNEHGIKTHEVTYIPFFIVWSNYSPNSFSPRTLLDIVKTTLKWRRSQKKIMNFISKEKYDIIHLNSIAISNVAQVLLKEKIPFIWHVREQGPQRHGFRYRFLSSLLKRSPAVVFLSKSEQRSWVNNNHGHVVHNFIDFKKFDRNLNKHKSKYRAELNLSKDDFVILFLGGTKWYKGLDLLLKAVKRLNTDKVKILIPDYKIPQTSRVTKIIIRMKQFFDKNANFQQTIDHYISTNLKKNCVKIPFNPESVPFFVASDLVVFPARQPHFARPIIEAGAMSKPVIASDFEVLRELVDNNVSGMLIDTQNTQLFAEKIKLLIDSPDLCSKLGEAGYVKSRELFQFEKQMQKIIEIYITVENGLP